MNETGYGETEFYDNKAIDRNKRTYPETNKTVYGETEFRKERWDKYNYYQEMNETDYRETELYGIKAIDQNRKKHIQTWKKQIVEKQNYVKKRVINTTTIKKWIKQVMEKQNSTITMQLIEMNEHI